jgi:hypothetical protein
MENQLDQRKREIDIPMMLAKLNSLFDKEENLKKQMSALIIEYEQLKDDIEMLQTMIMYSSNKRARI